MTDTLLDVSDQIAAELERDDDDGEALRETLAAGVTAYYIEDDTPPRHAIKHYPDGRRELILMERGFDRLVRPL